MSRVQPPGSPCGSPFSTPLAMNTVGGGQVASVGLTKLLMENGALVGKWLSKVCPLGVVDEHCGDSSPGWVLPSIHLTFWVVADRSASFWNRQLIGVPAWSTWVVPALAC